MGLFSKIKEGLFKTRGSVGQKMDQLVENSRALDDDFYDELSDILVMADVGVTTATEAVDELRERVTAEKITDAAKAKEIFKEILAARMRDKPMVLESPSVIFIIGVNGVGKTTSIGKLASRLKTVGRRVLIVAGDTFRAAAAEQLTVLAGCTQMLDLVHLAGESVVPADAAPELRLAANRMTLTDHDTGAAAELLYGMVRRAETSA